MKNSQINKDVEYDVFNDIKVIDPYRWLEKVEDPEVVDWIKIHNEKTDSVLKDESFKTFTSELAKNFKYVGFSNPIPVQGRYFYTERQPDEDQAVLYVKKGLNGNPVKLFDPNGKRDGNTVSIDYWQESRTGEYIAYGISEGGDEMSTLYIKEVGINKELSEKIIHSRHAFIRWLPDDSGFFYTRNPRPGTVPKNEEHLHVKVYFHKLGDNPENDELIFGAGRPKDDMIGIALSLDGKYLAVDVSQNWSENDVYIYNTETKQTTPLIVGIHAKFSVRYLKDKVLIETNYKANNGRVLWSKISDFNKPIDEWAEFIPEKKFLLQSMWVTKSKILVEYLVNACSDVVILDYEGRETGKIPLPEYSSLSGISARREEEEFFFGVDSYIFPKILYRYDPETLEYSENKKTDNPINPDNFEVRQEWYLSKDGTKVPIFIFHKKGVGFGPTVLNGYGGFGSNQVPTFFRNWVPWIERGGIFAVANIRGGGEFGDSWHKGGIKEKKQNSFDDFISAAEYLIFKKYTDREHVGIIGASNGGLLVSAVGVQRPDLFKAVCSKVPLTDMVRFPKFGMAVRWVHEYGNPEISEELKNILLWSPYHNVKPEVVYPSFFFTTANKDTRVDPLHARKMAAMLEGANEQNKVLVFTETEAGHGPGKPVVKLVETQALIISFFAHELGLTL